MVNTSASFQRYDYNKYDSKSFCSVTRNHDTRLVKRPHCQMMSGSEIENYNSLFTQAWLAQFYQTGH